MNSEDTTQGWMRCKQRVKRYRFMLAPVLVILLQACNQATLPQGDAVLPDQVPINRIQTIGTHNSYHLAPFPGIVALARQRDYRPGGLSVEAFAQSFDYEHPSLTEQLQLGVRHFEIDVYDDPQGGRFADSGSYALLRKHNLLPANADRDPQDKLKQPGIKVFHLPETDFRSTCLLLRECLREIKRWSDEHRRHVPVMIQIEPKEQGFPALNPDYPDVAVLPWNEPAWQRLVEPGHPAAAFTVINDPFDERISKRLAEGYLVRTRADAGTIEARQNDYRRRDRAFASGAQFISTDYPVADRRFSDYRVIFTGGQYVRVTKTRL